MKHPVSDPTPDLSTDPMDDIRTSLRHHQTRLEDALQKVRDALAAVGDSLQPVFPDAQPKRKGMSAASRAAASKRMKAYWRKRRKAGTK